MSKVHVLLPFPGLALRARKAQKVKSQLVTCETQWHIVARHARHVTSADKCWVVTSCAWKTRLPPGGESPWHHPSAWQGKHPTDGSTRDCEKSEDRKSWTFWSFEEFACQFTLLHVIPHSRPQPFRSTWRRYGIPVACSNVAKNPATTHTHTDDWNAHPAWCQIRQTQLAAFLDASNRRIITWHIKAPESHEIDTQTKYVQDRPHWSQGHSKLKACQLCHHSVTNAFHSCEWLQASWLFMT